MALEIVLKLFYFILYSSLLYSSPKFAFAKIFRPALWMWPKLFVPPRKHNKLQEFDWKTPFWSFKKNCPALLIVPKNFAPLFYLCQKTSSRRKSTAHPHPINNESSLIVGYGFMSVKTPLDMVVLLDGYEWNSFKYKYLRSGTHYYTQAYIEEYLMTSFSPWL